LISAETSPNLINLTRRQFQAIGLRHEMLRRLTPNYATVAWKCPANAAAIEQNKKIP